MTPYRQPQFQIELIKPSSFLVRQWERLKYKFYRGPKNCECFNKRITNKCKCPVPFIHSMSDVVCCTACCQFHIKDVDGKWKFDDEYVYRLINYKKKKKNPFPNFNGFFYVMQFHPDGKPHLIEWGNGYVEYPAISNTIIVHY